MTSQPSPSPAKSRTTIHRRLTQIALVYLGTAFFLHASEPKSAILLQPSSIMVNGEAIASLQPGANLLVLGEKADSSEFIVQHTTSDGERVVGMLPQNAVVLSKTTTQPTAIQPTAPPAEVRSSSFDKADTLSATDLSKQLREDKTAFIEKYKGQQLKIFGSIEKTSLESISGSNERQVVVTLATASGLPKVKVRLSPSIAKNREVLKQYHYFPEWFYGYYGSTLEFRQSSMNQIHARVSYKRTSTYADSNYYSNGKSYSSKHSSDWFPIFSPNDPMTVEGFVKGVSMDIEIDGALLISPLR